MIKKNNISIILISTLHVTYKYSFQTGKQDKINTYLWTSELDKSRYYLS